MSLILRIPRSKPKTLLGLIIILAFVTTIWGCGGGGGGGSTPPDGLPPGSDGGGSSGDGGSVTYSVRLAWDAPETRVSGVTLSNSEILKYKLRYGDCDSPDRTDWTTVEITNPGTNTVYRTVSGLSAGQYCFQVNAVDSNGLESDYHPATSGEYCVNLYLNGTYAECIE